MRGQPKLEVSKEQIQFLRELHFPWVRIAELLGISTKTLSRRRQEFQIDDEEEMNWSSAGNGELREILQEMVTGHLATREFRHQPTRHQETTSPPTNSPPSEVSSPPNTNKKINYSKVVELRCQHVFGDVVQITMSTMKTRNRRYPRSSEKKKNLNLETFSRRVPDFIDGRRSFPTIENSRFRSLPIPSGTDLSRIAKSEMRGKKLNLRSSGIFPTYEPGRG